MTVTELLPTIKNLSRADQLRIMQFLVLELAKEEDALLQPGATYTVWSPYNSHEAAHKLAELLEDIENVDWETIKMYTSALSRFS